MRLGGRLTGAEELYTRRTPAGIGAGAAVEDADGGGEAEPVRQADVRPAAAVAHAGVGGTDVAGDQVRGLAAGPEALGGGGDGGREGEESGDEDEGRARHGGRLRRWVDGLRSDLSLMRCGGNDIFFILLDRRQGPYLRLKTGQVSTVCFSRELLVDLPPKQVKLAGGRKVSAPKHCPPHRSVTRTI